MRILLVDDERLARFTVRSMLEEQEPANLQFSEAQSGPEALQALQNAPLPDLVFIDFKMPMQNGLETIRLARQKGICTNWVLLSGYDIPPQEASEDILCTIAKPARPEELTRALALCRQRRALCTF